MEKELTETQKFMISKINEAIKSEKEKFKKANDHNKPLIRIRIKQLEKQLEEASRPFERSEEEKELIEKMTKNVEKNAEITPGGKIMGDRSDKKLTSKEEFEHKLGLYIQDMENKKVALEKQLTINKEIYKVLNEHTPVSEETGFKSNVAELTKNLENLEITLRIIDDRLSEKDFVKEVIENYDKLSKINKFLGNPLQFLDYQEYIEGIKNSIKEKK